MNMPNKSKVNPTFADKKPDKIVIGIYPIFLLWFRQTGVKCQSAHRSVGFIVSGVC